MTENMRRFLEALRADGSSEADLTKIEDMGKRIELVKDYSDRYGIELEAEDFLNSELDSDELADVSGGMEYQLGKGGPKIKSKYWAAYWEWTTKYGGEGAKIDEVCAKYGVSRSSFPKVDEGEYVN